MNNKKKERIKEEIMDFISDMPRSCVELERKFPILKVGNGNGWHCSLHYGTNKNKLSNVIIWDFSDIGSEIIKELQTEKKASFVPCHWLVYHADGKLLDLPHLNDDVKIPKTGVLKKPYWFPCILTTYDKWIEWKNS